MENQALQRKDITQIAMAFYQCLFNVQIRTDEKRHLPEEFAFLWHLFLINYLMW
jgi:hypothetical protein